MVRYRYKLLWGPRVFATTTIFGRITYRAYYRASHMSVTFDSTTPETKLGIVSYLKFRWK